MSNKSTMSGCQYKQPLVNQTPIFDNRRKHRKPAMKHSGNLPRKPKWVK